MAPAKRSKSRSQVKTSLTYVGESLSYTAANRYGVNNIVNLHTAIEALRSEDGTQAKVRNIRIFYRLWNDSAAESFAAIPVLVQTAGNFVDTIDRSESTIATILDVAIDDVFGYRVLRPHFLISRSPAPGDNKQFLAFDIDVPQDLIGILNKETESERLQSLFLALVHAGMAVQIVSSQTWYEITYTEVQKPIISR